MDEPLTVGQSAPRIDAAGKAAGNEKYTADYYPENYLVVGPWRFIILREDP
jgi:hypothetical protein